MNLQLNKQQIVALNNNEMNAIRGGGIKVSIRKTGDCRYSRKNPNSTGNGCVKKSRD
ncbi:MAG: class I lanthipeptide [Salibacteraceae bacterium]